MFERQNQTEESKTDMHKITHIYKENTGMADS